MSPTAVPTEFELSAFLERERVAVEHHLSRLLGRLEGVPAPAAAAIRYAVGAGGKRLRPVLTVACYRAAGGEEAGMDAAYRLGCAVELLHTYSLVHDDLPAMDDDDVRRGRPTTHRAHGVGTAAAAGLLLIPLAARVVDAAARDLALEPERRRHLLLALAEGAGAAGMVGGPWLDLAAEDAAVDVETLERVHARKTGALISAAALSGAIAAGADGGVLDALRGYGARLGLAFQIADDLLDVVGDEVDTGKSAGRDALLGKATYPALLGLHAARERALAETHVAIRLLLEGGVATPALVGLARYAVERRG